MSKSYHFSEEIVWWFCNYLLRAGQLDQPFPFVKIFCLFLFDGGGCCAIDVDVISSSSESLLGAYEGPSESDLAS